MVATLPSEPYITEMIPAGFTAEERMTYKMTGFFAEVFENLQVIEEALKEVMVDLCCCILNKHLTGFLSLQGIMNFTYSLIKPPDEQWGSIQPDGTWSGMVNLLANQDIDIAATDFTVTKERSAVMTFATPITQIHHTLFIKNPAERFNIMAYIEPMHWFTWVSLFVLLATVPPLLYLAIR